MQRRVTLFDIADALGISTGTVHRALHDHPGVNAMTRTRVLQMSKSMGYRPNLAARFLSQRRQLRISVNTLKGTTSFWDEVRSGIQEGAHSLGMDSVEVTFRTYPNLGEGEEEALEAALDSGVNGIIMFASRPKNLRTWMRRASRAKIPIVCVSTDAPDTGRLAVVSMDTMASGSLAASLMGRFLRGEGKVTATMSEMAIAEHAEKFRAFHSTMSELYPGISILDPIEDHDIESEAFEKCKALIHDYPDLGGIYVTTEASIPVLEAAREAAADKGLQIITTDLFPKLVDEIRAGTVAATIYQRPRTQGRLAFRILHGFLVEGRCPSHHITLAPHLVMNGNLDFFLDRLEMNTNEWAAGTQTAPSFSEELEHIHYD